MVLEWLPVHFSAEGRHWWFVARRKIVCGLVEQVLGNRCDPLVVDLGCGSGGNTYEVAKTYRCCGVDPSEQAILQARSTFPELPFICGSVGHSQVNALIAAADVVLITDVIEHVDDDSAFLRSVVELLRPGGIVLITVPADMALWSRHDITHGHFRRYDWETLQALWAGVAMTPLLLSYFNCRLYGIIRIIRFVSNFLGCASGASGTDLLTPPVLLNRLLQRVFVGELTRLLRVFAGKCSAYSYGVSLIAIVRHDPVCS